MIADVVSPESHHAWCEDRLKPRSLDHWTDGVRGCWSHPISIGGIWVHLVQVGDSVMVQIDERRYTIPEAVQIAAAIHASIDMLGATA